MSYLTDKGCNVLVYPSDDIHQLRISFPFPSTDEYWQIKPEDYIRFIFAHEAPGSLNSYLKKKSFFPLIFDKEFQKFH